MIGVVLPSYNEAENIAALVAEIRAAVPEAAIVIVDDSPNLATVNAVAPLRGPSVRVIHRDSKGGRGSNDAKASLLSAADAKEQRFGGRGGIRTHEGA